MSGWFFRETRGLIWSLAGCSSISTAYPWGFFPFRSCNTLSWSNICSFCLSWASRFLLTSWDL